MVDGLVVCGSTSDFTRLSVEENMQIMKIARAAVQGKKQLICGATAPDSYTANGDNAHGICHLPGSITFLHRTFQGIYKYLHVNVLASCCGKNIDIIKISHSGICQTARNDSLKFLIEDSFQIICHDTNYPLLKHQLEAILYFLW